MKGKCSRQRKEEGDVKLGERERHMAHTGRSSEAHGDLGNTDTGCQGDSGDRAERPKREEDTDPQSLTQEDQHTQGG